MSGHVTLSPELLLIAASHQTHSRWRAGGSRNIALLANDSALRKTIQMRCWDKGTIRKSEIGVASIIRQDDNNVRLGGQSRGNG